MYTQVVSLGGRCQVAHQLNRFFKNSLDSQIFNWLITPDRSLLDMLEDRFAKFYNPEFKIGSSNMPHYEHAHVFECGYGILLSHDFKNDSTPILEQWDDIKGKYIHLISRFFSLLKSRERILFVRQSCGKMGSFGYDVNDRANFDLGVRLQNLIKRINPDLLFDILLVSHFEVDVAQVEGISVAYMPEQNEIWSGHDLLWDRILSPIKYSFNS